MVPDTLIERVHTECLGSVWLVTTFDGSHQTTGTFDCYFGCRAQAGQKAWAESGAVYGVRANVLADAMRLRVRDRA